MSLQISLTLLILLSIIMVGVACYYAARLILNRLSTPSQDLDRFRTLLSEQIHTAAQTQNQALTNSTTQLNQLLSDHLHKTRESLENRFSDLTKSIDSKLLLINQKVEQRLQEGFEKTTATFTDIVKRLALIDEAQKQITRLSEEVVSLQSVLSDKRSRGAFGEVQLSALIRNVLPEKVFTLQAALPNGTRVDCLLRLPEPTGTIAIDAKFPLETFRALQQEGLSPDQQRLLSRQFKQDIKKHITDIATKYILPGTTSDGAILFLPSESIFAEIHGQFSDLVEYAHEKRVWITSPTTMMAILTTARAVIKDAATRQQVHVIQEHLAALSKDFGRFQKRMDNLSRHINQAQTDVEEIHVSSKKISQRFERIEKVELCMSGSDSLISEESET